MRKLTLTKPISIYEAPVAEQLREPRTPLEIVGTIIVDGQRLPARVCDLSGHGFGARSVATLPIGSRITVTLPVLGEVRAEVRWALGGMFGARFVDEVNMSALLQNQQVAVQPQPC